MEAVRLKGSKVTTADEVLPPWQFVKTHRKTCLEVARML